MNKFLQSKSCRVVDTQSRTFYKLYHVLNITVCHLGKYANVVLLENEKAIQNALQIFPLIQRIFQHLRGREHIDKQNMSR